MYFKEFPTIPYEYNIGGKQKIMLVTDITRNVRFRKEVLSNITLYDEYDIVDGETPEIIAEKVYGSSEYHWVVMLVNSRFDYIEDFPLNIERLEVHIKDKYGEDNIYETHHYVDTRGFVVNDDHPEAQPVSNYDYEVSVNESKRRIKLISNDLLKTILNNYRDLM